MRNMKLHRIDKSVMRKGQLKRGEGNEHLQLNIERILERVRESYDKKDLLRLIEISPG